MKLLYHLTLNTGDVTRTPRSEVSQQVIDHLLPLIDNEAGKFEPINIGFDIWRPLTDDDKPIDGAAVIHLLPWPDQESGMTYVIAMACWKQEMSEGSWERLREIYQEWEILLKAMKMWRAMPDAAPPVPWLAVIPLPTISLLDPDRLMMMGDMERCLFWALAEGSGS
jgi:hypothetical protein